jgi:hypothetical protein
MRMKRPVNRSRKICLLAGYFLESFLDPEDGASSHFRNVIKRLPDYKAPHSLLTGHVKLEEILFNALF